MILNQLKRNLLLTGHGESHLESGYDIMDVILVPGGTLYFGDADTDGTWRWMVDGNNFKCQVRQSGVYNSEEEKTPPE